MSLNCQQHDAATTKAQRTLVLAGPGTGKTTTLVGRFVHLVRICGVDPKRIFVATFTAKAAAELQFRIRQALPELGDIDHLPIGTFHCLTRQLLRTYPRPDLGPKFDVFNPTDIMSVVNEQMRNSGHRIFHSAGGKSLTEIIAGWKDRRLTKADLFDRNISRDEQKARDLWDEYNEILRARRVLDFSGLINRCANELDEQLGAVDFREAVHGLYDHFLIDEYQDINEAQNHLIKGLVHPASSLWVVGDDDQSLYQFRGAAPEYIINFSCEWPGAEKHHLSNNYRSAYQILSAAQAVICENVGRFEKKVVAAAPQQSTIMIAGFPNDNAEASWVAEQIEQRLKDQVKASDIAVLFRSNAVAVKLHIALSSRGIKVSFAKDGYEWWMTRCVATYCGMVMRHANKGAQDIKDCGFEFSREFNQAAEYWATKSWEEARIGIAQNVASYAKELGLDQVDALDWEDNVRMVADMAMEHKNVESFLRFVTKQRSQSNKTNQHHVRLLTVHGAKGLEWNHVFIIGAEDGQFPHRLSQSLEELAEERRIMFVAMTRPRMTLCLTYCHGSRRSRGVSPYLRDMMRGLAYNDVVFATGAAWHDLCDDQDRHLSAVEAQHNLDVRLRRQIAALPYSVQCLDDQSEEEFPEDNLFIPFTELPDVPINEYENFRAAATQTLFERTKRFTFDESDEVVECIIPAGWIAQVAVLDGDKEDDFLEEVRRMEHYRGWFLKGSVPSRSKMYYCCVFIHK